MNIREATWDEMRVFWPVVKVEEKAIPREQRSPWLGSEVSLIRFWKARCYVLEVAGQIVSFHAALFGQRPPKNAWGRYCNSLTAYTLPSCRCRGYATAVFHRLQTDADLQGIARIKSLARSTGGVRLHLRAGHDMWGVLDAGEVVVDSPARRGAAFPDGVPIDARNNAKRGRVWRMTPADLHAAMQAEPFNCSPDEPWMQRLLALPDFAAAAVPPFVPA